MGGIGIFKMLPWIFGIYEMQLHRLDREFVELNEEVYPVFSKQFFDKTPQLMQTLPIEEELSVVQEALPYERVSNIVENSQSFMVFDCVCKKEQGLIDNPCEKPVEVCMAFAPIPGNFDNSTHGRAISKDEAKAVLDKAEEAGLVHLTNNFQSGHIFICNCCGCCCAVLGAINKLGIPTQTVINSHYYAVINPDDCTVCGICAEERCQINAIEEGDEAFEIIKEKCIGCGLCITKCPDEAISLHRREEKDILIPPSDEMDWYKQRGKNRGVDFSKYQ
jgi:ferredoxin